MDTLIASRVTRENLALAFLDQFKDTMLIKKAIVVCSMLNIELNIGPRDPLGADPSQTNRRKTFESEATMSVFDHSQMQAVLTAMVDCDKLLKLTPLSDLYATDEWAADDKRKALCQKLALDAVVKMLQKYLLGKKKVEQMVRTFQDDGWLRGLLRQDS
ncbi:hypothetical protein LTR66_015224 [Elasticomyces elasticus]|nr:hypothetical protein LTR66_015224 [Elasticomyces elasticus]